MQNEEKRSEGVYGENLDPTVGTSVSGIREETVHVHPQPTGDGAVDADGADQNEGPKESVAEAFDEVRDGVAKETGSGGMGRDGTPRNADETAQGQFGGGESETATTPG